MNDLAEFALGLGIFFVGMQMVGEYLRQLSGPSFRSLVARFTSSAWAGAALGLAAGAMMQSATGVTFILVNMVASGLVVAEAALPVIAWTNVGLTALAFVATLDIHPFVAWTVGLSGLAAALVRHRLSKQIASILLGIALLLFGLQTMGTAAEPLAHSELLRSFVSHTVASPAVAFLFGFFLAAILQSNTGATLLVITLAAGGVFRLESAAMLIYGTNLGAIVLRMLLSLGMRGTTMQLVRFEDLFCVVSGVLMVALYCLETLTGVPLVLAAVKSVGPNIALQLALVFLLSNLLPAIVLSPFLSRLVAAVARIWPADEGGDAARPKYLSARSLEDPVTAVDLIPRELARLLASLQASVRAHRAGTDSGVIEDRRAADYAMLTRRIEDLAGQLALAPLQKSVAERLNIAREMTAVVGYVAESYVQLRRSHREVRRAAETAVVREEVLSALEALLGAAALACDKRQSEAVEALREQSRSHSQLVEQARESCVRGAEREETGARAVAQRTAMLKMLGDFELITWIVHRLSKLLEQFDARRSERPK